MTKIEFVFDELPQLPKSWEWKPLEKIVVDPKKDIVDGPFGSDLKASEYTGKGIPIARLQNIDRNIFVQKNIRFVSPKKAEELNRHNFKPGDILITKLGDPLGKACIVPQDIKHGIIVADLVRVRIGKNEIDRNYLTYAINSPFLIKQFERHTKGTTRPRVNLGMVRKIPIPFAPLNQQKLIVSEIEKQFSRIDEAVAGLKRIKANLKRYKASVLKAAVEGKLTEEWRKNNRDIESAEKLLKRILAERKMKWEEANPKKKYKEPAMTDTFDLPELPKGWVWASTEQLTWYITSGSRDWKQYYSDKGALFIRTQDINKNRLDLNEIAYVDLPSKAEGKRSLVELNDILVIITGANVGKVALVEKDLPEAYVSQSVGLMKFSNKNIIRYIHFAMIAEGAGKLQLKKMVYGMGRPVLSLENLREIILPLPSEKEQQQIVEKVEERLSVVNEIEAELETNLKRAERLRQAILKKAFSGGLVARDSSAYEREAI